MRGCDCSLPIAWSQVIRRLLKQDDHAYRGTLRERLVDILFDSLRQGRRDVKGEMGCTKQTKYQEGESSLSRQTNPGRTE